MSLNLNSYPIEILKEETSSEKVVSLSNLSCYFHPFVVNGEFIPVSPWENRTIKNYPSPNEINFKNINDYTNSRFKDLFINSIQNLIKDKEIIGLSFSGGMDSTAILYYLLKIKDSKQKIVLFHIEMTDDQGVSSRRHVERILKELEFSSKIIYVDFLTDNKHLDLSCYPWSEKGPALSSFPYLLQNINTLANKENTEILLHGDGANELLEAPCFLFKSLFQESKLKAARYLLDISDQFGFNQVKQELIYLISSKQKTYNKRLFERGHLSNNIISSEFKSFSDDWFSKFIIETETFLNNFALWETKELIRNVFPHSAIEDNGRVQEASPFLEPNLVKSLFQMPTYSRFDYSERSYYLRNKSLLVEILPEELKVLFKEKQIFSKAFENQFKALIKTDKSLIQCSKFNLIDKNKLLNSDDPALISTVYSIEDWLSIAIEKGYKIKV